MLVVFGITGDLAKVMTFRSLYRLERRGNLLNVFGGKMTTFRSLAEKAAMRVDNYFGEPRVAREAKFFIRG